MFDLQAQNSAGAGVLLQPGANYIILEAFIDPQQGAISSSPDAQSNVQTLISESANINNQIQTLNGTWGNFEGTNGAALQKGVNLTANAIDTAMIVTLVGKYSNQLCGAVNPGAGGTIGNVGVANLPPDTMNVNSLPDLHVSAACPQINTWEILGNWKLQLSGNDLKLKQLKFNVWRGNSSGPSPTENGAVSNEYRVFVSTDPVNYSGTAVASGTISNINTISFTMPLQNGGALLGQNWINTTGDVYYVTLEGKPFENTTYNETAQPIRSYINLDPAFSWGTFGEGKPWAHEATGNNSAIQSSSLAASVQGQGTLLWGGGRTLNQIDAEHPVASCVGLSDPATDLTFTQNIKEVQISACNNTNTDWVAVFQGTIETGYQSLALDGIPTVIREVGNTGLGGDEVAMVKLIISNTADYAASEVASYEMDPASSWFLLATPGLTLQPQTTYYTTYLVRPNPNLAYTPGPNRKVQVGWMGNAFAITKLGNAVVGHFSPSTTNLDARLENPGMNITISPNPSYQAPNQSGKFWFTPCAN